MRVMQYEPIVITTFLWADCYCSDQNLTTPQDRDTCLAKPEVSQVDNELEIPLSSHSLLRKEPRTLPWYHTQPRGESIRPCPSSYSTQRRGSWAHSFLDIRNYRISPLPPQYRLSTEISASIGHSSAVGFSGSRR